MKSQQKLVYGVGINDADYEVTRYEVLPGKRLQTWMCPFYIRWASMIQRCYDAKCQIQHPTYIGCSVTTEWHLFSAFKAWMETQDWEGKDLDKDLLCRNNRIYSPQTCAFVSRQINSLVRELNNSDGALPIGVMFYEKRKKFRSRATCVLTRKRSHLGYFDTPQEAHAAWLAARFEQAKLLADQQVDPRVSAALLSLYVSHGVQNA
ncbi:hypothetical protein [Pseudomonas petrae]|uniref:hypothetical protein n=1 Tax=Pseudomonas petrae TaxID=2912190 RepID=UPI001F459A52|nr:hypothetical protein [Pseudomonas petrae]MCF7536195.1 hypothetical protein [Pseudomonas petrae]